MRKIIVHTPDEAIKAIEESKNGDIIIWEDSVNLRHEYQKKVDAYITDLKQSLTESKLLLIQCSKEKEGSRTNNDTSEK